MQKISLLEVLGGETSNSLCRVSLRAASFSMLGCGTSNKFQSIP